MQLTLARHRTPRRRRTHLQARTSGAAATEAQWRALIVATRGCNRCGATIDRCQAHHLHEWLDGGTDLPNLELLCHTCHGHAHRGSRGDPRRRRRRQRYQAASLPEQHQLTTRGDFDDGRTCGGVIRR